MKRDIRTTLAIDGEREFKKALSDAGREMRVLASESKAVTAAFGNNKGSAEALTAKNKVLTKQIDQQEEIYKALAKAVKESTAKYGEANKITDGYRVKMNNASATLDKMKTELKQNKSALEKMASAEKSAGKQADRMGRELKGVGNDVKRFKAKIKDFASSSVGQFASMSGAIAGVIQLFKEMWDTISESAMWSKEVANISKTTGMAIDKYQEWDYVFKQLDHSMEQASGDLAALGEKAMDAAAGAGEGAELFGKLGISVTDSNGVLKSQQQLLDDTIIALQGMANETERNAIASALLSTTGEKLAPILGMTSEQVDGLKKEAHEMGTVIKTGAVVQLELLQQELDKTAAVTEAASKRMSAKVASETRKINKAWRDIVNTYEDVSLRINVSGGGVGLDLDKLTKSKEELEEMAEKAMLVDAVMEVWSIDAEEVTSKHEELAQVLINNGVPSAEAQTQAYGLLTQSIDAQTYATEQMSAAQGEYDVKIQAAFDNYTALKDKYLAAVESTTAKYLASMGGLFAKFDAGLADSQEALDKQSAELLDNLQSQVDGLSGWAEAFDKLSKRGVDEGLLKTLRDMGPDAYAEINALNNMTDEELTRYQGLFKQRGELATGAAVDALEPLAKEVEAALKEVKATIAAEDEAMKELGENLGKGIGDGIDSSQWYIKSAAREAVEAAIEAAEQAADINSPSRLARDKVGLNIGYGIGGGTIDGLKTMIPDIKLGLTDAMSAIGSGINAMDSFINSDNRTNMKQTVIHQTNHFDRYSSRDGAAAVRDLNRQLGWAY